MDTTDDTQRTRRTDGTARKEEANGALMRHATERGADDKTHTGDDAAMQEEQEDLSEPESDGNTDANSPLIPAGHPRALFTEGYSYGLRILSDRLTVQYVQKAMHLLDVGTVRSEQPMPTAAEAPVYYFELNVLDAGEHSQIAIGIAPLQSSCLFAPGGMHAIDTPCPPQASSAQHATASLTCRQVGMDVLSYGYRADEGRKFHAAAVIQAGRPTLVGHPYGPPFSTGDTVGCGVNFYTGSVFFTHNGRHLGTAFQLSPSEWSKAASDPREGMRHPRARPIDARVRLYPTVSLHSKGELVRFNFGAQPFQFDFASYASTERALLEKQIQTLPFDRASLLPLVRSYLLHQGYDKTLDALTQVSEGSTAASASAASASTASSAPAAAATAAVPQSRHDEVAASSLAARQSIRELVESGEMERALEAVQSLAPTLWTSTKVKTVSSQLPVQVLHLRLLAHRFLQLLSTDSPTRDEDALTYAQQHLWRFQESSNPRVRKAAEEVLSAFAFPSLRRSPLAFMLEEAYRRETAEQLNSALLANLAAPSCAPASMLHGVSSLEIMLRHALAAEGILRSQGLPVGLPAVLDKEEQA